MSKVRTSVYWSALTRYSGFAIQFGSTVALARMLPPEAIGIFSVSMAFVVVIQALREFGIANYLIQAPELDRATLRRAQGMAIAMAWTLAALLWLGRDAVAAFYGEQGVADVLAVLAAGFALVPFGLVARATLVRELRLDRMCIVELLMVSTQAGVAVYGASAGWGFMSMAWGQLAGQLAALLALTALRPSHVFMLPLFTGCGAMLRFGSMSSGGALLSQAGLFLPDMILGRMIGFGAVAFYSRAIGLTSLYSHGIEGIVMPVALPSFAASRNSPGGMAAAFLRALPLLTAFAWPFFACLGVLAEPIVLLLYGEKWAPSIPILQLLCVAMTALPVASLASQAFLAAGAVRQNLVRIAIVQALSLVLITASAMLDVRAVAASQIVVGVFNVALTLGLLRSLFGISRRAALAAMAGSLKITAATGLAAAAAAAAAAWVAAPLALPAGLLAAAGAWLGAVLVTRHPAAEEVRHVVGLLRRRDKTLAESRPIG